jgi:hypothetical protein
MQPSSITTESMISYGTSRSLIIIRHAVEKAMVLTILRRCESPSSFLLLSAKVFKSTVRAQSGLTRLLSFMDCSLTVRPTFLTAQISIRSGIEEIDGLFLGQGKPKHHLRGSPLCLTAPPRICRAQKLAPASSSVAMIDLFFH